MRLSVDLAAQTVTTPSGTSFRFEVDPFRKGLSAERAG